MAQNIFEKSLDTYPTDCTNGTVIGPTKEESESLFETCIPRYIFENPDNPFTTEFNRCSLSSHSQ